SQLLYSRREDYFGSGTCKFKWRPGGNMLAASGSNNILAIFDRKGEPIDAHHTTSPVIDFAWDHEGDVIAMLIDKSPILTLFDVATRGMEMIDVSTGPKEFPLCVAWSPVKQVLCCGNSNGNVVIYDHSNQKKNPIMGKHQRRITHIFISADDVIACASEDSSISLSNFDGETLHQLQCTSAPWLVRTFEMRMPRADEPSQKSKQTETHLSAILGTKHLMLVNLAKESAGGAADVPTVNLAFQEQYGDIVTYNWYDNGRLIVGFRSGQWVSISARENEIGSELHTEKAFSTYLSDITVNQALGRIICCGDNQIRIYDLQSYQILEIVGVLESEKELVQVEISPDTRMCAVASAGGFVGVYLVAVSQLGTAYKDTIAVLTAIDEITVMKEVDKRSAITVPTVVEPSVIAVGPRHVGVGVNNTVWFYDYANRTSQPVSHYEYLSTVLDVRVNGAFAVVIMDGRLRLQTILEDDHLDAAGLVRSANFPEPERNARLVDAALTEDFLIFATDTNYVVYFALTEWQVVSEYRHPQGIRKIFVEPDGVRLILFDGKMDTFVYSPVDDSLLKLPAIGATIQYKGALWETFTIDRDTFIVYDSNEIYVFLLSRDEIGGEGIVNVGKTKLDYGHTPLMLSKGIVNCLTTSGRTSTILLQSNMTDNVFERKKPDEFVAMLKQAISLKRWTYAMRLCEFAKQDDMWRDLGKALLRNNEVSMARRVFGLIDDVGMVWSLEDIELMEERSLRSGHLAVLLGDVDAAESLFLNSSQPIEALNMRRDLLHWPRALSLAQQLKPDEIPHISKEYAQQLEYNGQYVDALRHYEEGELKAAAEETDEMLEHNEICRSGIARMAIRTGDLRRGFDLARQLNGRIVKRDCAIILEELRQYSDAAVLFEQGRYYDRAAAVCLKAKNWVKVADLLPNVRSPKIHSQYGRVMEADQKYKQAAIAYKNARDYDNLVRILLNHLNMPEEAVAIVRESRSAEGAKLVANFFIKLGDQSSAIKFLVMSQCHAEAYYLAEQHMKMDEYAEAMGINSTTEQFAQIADYYLAQGNTVEAGRFYLYASNHQLALNLLLTPENGENQHAMRLAIDTCAQSRDPALRKHLTSFLMGEEDGRPKDPRFIFKMFVAFGQTREAARTAVLIARDEQERGSSKTAHKHLHDMYKELHLKGMRVPTEMDDLLMYIHSYLITKRLIQRGEIKAAARMLLRTAANISLFKKNATTILTSAVVICAKAELPHAALKHAKTLMSPDHRPKIDQRYAKKIEQLVRKGAPLSSSAQAEVEESTPCPFCFKNVINSTLICDHCKSRLPYCIVTGRHVLADDFAVCPNCDFPAIRSEMIRDMKSSNYTCPMCEEPVEMEQLTPIEFKTYVAREEQREIVNF
ncbi:hypothetical protein PENTCL1PPCAC_12596, partial [Pristionchus entomophagus]